MDLKVSARPLPASSPVHDYATAVLDNVSNRLGAQTRWNGVIRQTSEPMVESASHPDGQLTVNKHSVVGVLNRAEKGRRVPAAEVLNAVDSLVHEGCHLSAQLGQPGQQIADPYESAAVTGFAEGLVRVWTEDNRADVLQDLRLDDRFPGVSDAPPPGSFPEFATAARGIVESLADESGRPAADVLRDLVTADLHEKWGTAAQIVIDSQLPGQLPQRQGAELRQDVAAVMRGHFSKTVHLYADRDLPPQERIAQAAAVPAAVMAEARGTVEGAQAQLAAGTQPDRAPMPSQDHRNRISADQTTGVPRQVAPQQSAGRQSPAPSAQQFAAPDPATRHSGTPGSAAAQGAGAEDVAGQAATGQAAAGRAAFGAQQPAAGALKRPRDTQGGRTGQGRDPSGGQQRGD